MIRCLFALLILLTPICAHVASSPAQARSTTEMPNGRLAYPDRFGDIWVVDADGSNRKRVTTSGIDADFDPSWAPDGDRLVFRSTRGSHLPLYDGGEGIFVVDSDGSDEVEIGPSGGGGFPDWSPDGRAIALTAGTEPAWASLAVIKPDGTGLTDLGVAGECADWSPDGDRIAFCTVFAEPDDQDASRSQPTWELQFDVWTMDPDGTNLMRLTKDPKNEFPVGWSPDARWIVVETEGEGRYRMVAADGSTEWRPLISATRIAVRQFLAWLPDGRILFRSDPDPATGVLPWYVMNPDGTGTTRIDRHPEIRKDDLIPFSHRQQITALWTASVPVGNRL